MRALPETFRVAAEAAATAVVTDPARWGEQVRERHALVEVLQTALVGRRKVRLVYANRAGERTQRLVDPWGLADKDAIWYLLGGTRALRSAECRDYADSHNTRPQYCHR